MRLSSSLFAFAYTLAHSVSVIAVPTSGCGRPIASALTRGGAAFTNNLNFTTSSGTFRQYALHIPTTYDVNTAAPLAFSFHGRSATAASQESISQMSNETWNPNYLVVYPTGIDQQWQGDPAATTDDIGFTLELVANLSGTYCLDSSRVFAAGMSNGGGFAANILACDPVASRKFAGFGGMSGAYYQGTTDAGCSGDTVAISCNPGRAPVPVLETHGSADGVIPYAGGPRRNRCLPSIPRFMTDKAQRAGIGGVNTSIPYYDGNVLNYTYGNNASLTGVVTHYWVNGLGHTWPSIAAGAYFDATPVLFAFFDRWTLDKTPITYLDTTNSSSTTTSARPTSTSSTTSSISTSTTNTIQTSSSIPGASSRSISTSSSSSTTTSSSSSSSTGTSSSSGSSTITSTSSTRLASSTSTTSTTVSSKSSTTSAPPSSSSLSCPASNGQTYAASNGASFLVECDTDHVAGDMGMVYVKTYEECINECATTTGCVDVSLSGAACYLKKTLGAALSDSGIRGAKLIVVGSSTGSSSPSSSTTSPTSTPRSRRRRLLVSPRPLF